MHLRCRITASIQLRQVIASLEHVVTPRMKKELLTKILFVRFSVPSGVSCGINQVRGSTVDWTTHLN